MGWSVDSCSTLGTLYPVLCVRAVFIAGTTGVADDITIAQGIPLDARVVRVTLLISTAVATTTATVRTAIGGTGTALSAALITTATGRVSDVSTTTFAINRGSDLFLRRSNNKIAGEVIIELCPR